MLAASIANADVSAPNVRAGAGACRELYDFKFPTHVGADGIPDEVVTRTGSRLDPVRALARLAFWLVMLVVILLSSTALGLESINEMFGLMLGYIPTLISAIVIVILGMIVGEFVRALVLA